MIAQIQLQRKSLQALALLNIKALLQSADDFAFLFQMVDGDCGGVFLDIVVGLMGEFCDHV